MDALADRDLVVAYDAGSPSPTPASGGCTTSASTSARCARAAARSCATCLDWTERRPHLAGAAGAALCTRLTDNGWVERTSGRAVRVTEPGHRALHRLLGLTRDDLGVVPR